MFYSILAQRMAVSNMFLSLDTRLLQKSHLHVNFRLTCQYMK